MGLSLCRVEGFLGYFWWPKWAAVEGERELRKEFWETFWDGITISARVPELRQKAKLTKDIGFVVESLEKCSCVEDVDQYQLVRLEGVLRLSSGEIEK